MAEIGIDIGGTFVDVVLSRKPAPTEVWKFPSDPATLEAGILSALQKLLGDSDLSVDDVTSFAHGTTIATNALIEHNGARTAAIMTEGFGDVLEIRRLSREPGTLYQLKAARPSGLVPRNLRFEVAERVDKRGSVVTTLDEDRVREIADQLSASEVEAVAICLLFSFFRSDHEERIKDLLATSNPGLEISLSSSIAPEVGEYERASPTVANAFITPSVRSYLGMVEEVLASSGVSVRLRIMQTNGGIAGVESIQERPIAAVLSGPCAGAVAGAHIAEALGYAHAINIDMGGTSFDVSLVLDGGLARRDSLTVGSHKIRIPTVDIHTIGAGGGSITWLDAADGLHVGPRSAGANPGPASYGRGGEEFTVSDANLLLGYLGTTSLVGGQLSLDTSLAIGAAENLAGPLGMSVEDVALGVREIVNARMAAAIRTVTISRGHDPRDFALIAFGGAGPMHAVDLARELEIGLVVVPRHPGCLSATGVAVAPIAHDYVRALGESADEVSPETVSSAFNDLRSSARNDLALDGMEPEDCAIEFALGMRYRGQNAMLPVRVAESIDAPLMDEALQEVHELHQATYGYMSPDDAVEVVDARLRVAQRITEPSLYRLPAPVDATSRPTEHRDATFERTLGSTQMTVYDRTSLSAGMSVAGPAGIEEYDSTTLLPPGTTARVDSYGNLLIDTSGPDLRTTDV